MVASDAKELDGATLLDAAGQVVAVRRAGSGCQSRGQGRARTSGQIVGLVGQCGRDRVEKLFRALRVGDPTPSGTRRGVVQ